MQDTNNSPIFKTFLREGEEKTIRDITERTGFFTAEEVDIAEELAREHLQKGAKESGYFFVTAELNNETAGYTCYGPISGSFISYDLYWIVVAPCFQGKGFGKQLLQKTERLIQLSGGRNVYAETSSTALYAPTRAFYENNDFFKEAVLKDFYRFNDDKVIYVKKLYPET